MKQFGWQVVGCSTTAMQRQERHGRQELIAALTGQQYVTGRVIYKIYEKIHRTPRTAKQLTCYQETRFARVLSAAVLECQHLPTCTV